MHSGVKMRDSCYGLAEVQYPVSIILSGITWQTAVSKWNDRKPGLTGLNLSALLLIELFRKEPQLLISPLWPIWVLTSPDPAHILYMQTYICRKSQTHVHKLYLSRWGRIVTVRNWPCLFLWGRASLPLCSAKKPLAWSFNRFNGPAFSAAEILVSWLQHPTPLH